MRVILDGPDLGGRPAGPAVHLRSLAKALLDEDESLQLVLRRLGLRTWRGARATAETIDPRIRVRDLPVPNSVVRRLQSTVGVPSERALLGPYDVYHQLHADADPAVPDERLVVTLHDLVALHWPEEEGAMAPTARRLLERCAAVVTVSQYSQDEICSVFGLPENKVHVIYNGVDTSWFNVANAVAAESAARQWLGFDAPYLLYVGGGTPRKNVNGLLRAFEFLHTDRGADVDLVLAGPVKRNETVLRTVLPVGLQHRVHFIGFVDDKLVPGLYGLASALVSPSLYEGFGLPVVEAMACGIPVIASNRSALPEVAGAAAVFANPDNPEEISDAIARVLNETDVDRKERCEIGLDRVRHFSWRSAAQQTSALYAETVSR